MLLTDITKIIRVLLAAYQPIAAKDELTQRRIGQIGEVIGAVEDVAEDEEQDSPVAEKRVEEAHDIIHRVAAILAMEPDDGDGGGDGDGEAEADAGDSEGAEDADDAEGAEDAEADSGQAGDDEPLAEVAWDGTLDGETIELQDDEEE